MFLTVVLLLHSAETKAVEPAKSESSSQEQKTFFFIDNDPRIASEYLV